MKSGDVGHKEAPRNPRTVYRMGAPNSVKPRPASGTAVRRLRGPNLMAANGRDGPLKVKVVSLPQVFAASKNFLPPRVRILETWF